jgi:2-haloacid dehalogenase
LEHTWLQSFMNRYEDFWSLTQTALPSAARQLHIEMKEAEIDILMQAYLAAQTFVDVKPGLESLKGRSLSILSSWFTEDARWGRPTHQSGPPVFAHPFGGSSASI